MAAQIAKSTTVAGWRKSDSLGGGYNELLRLCEIVWFGAEREADDYFGSPVYRFMVSPWYSTSSPSIQEGLNLEMCESVFFHSNLIEWNLLIFCSNRICWIRVRIESWKIQNNYITLYHYFLIFPENGVRQIRSRSTKNSKWPNLSKPKLVDSLRNRIESGLIRFDSIRFGTESFAHL